MSCTNDPEGNDMIQFHVQVYRSYRISGIFRVGLIFAEFATSLKSRKIDTAKNKPYYTPSLRVLEIAKIRLSEHLTHVPSVIFAKISRREKFPIYGILSINNPDFEIYLRQMCPIELEIKDTRQRAAHLLLAGIYCYQSRGIVNLTLPFKIKQNRSTEGCPKLKRSVDMKSSR